MTFTFETTPESIIFFLDQPNPEAVPALATLCISTHGSIAVCGDDAKDKVKEFIWQRLDSNSSVNLLNSLFEARITTGAESLYPGITALLKEIHLSEDPNALIRREFCSNGSILQEIIDEYGEIGLYDAEGISELGDDDEKRIKLFKLLVGNIEDLFAPKKFRHEPYDAKNPIFLYENPSTAPSNRDGSSSVALHNGENHTISR